MSFYVHRKNSISVFIRRFFKKCVFFGLKGKESSALQQPGALQQQQPSALQQPGNHEKKPLWNPETPFKTEILRGNSELRVARGGSEVRLLRARLCWL